MTNSTRPPVAACCVTGIMIIDLTATLYRACISEDCVLIYDLVSKALTQPGISSQAPFYIGRWSGSREENLFTQQGSIELIV